MSRITQKLEQVKILHKKNYSIVPIEHNKKSPFIRRDVIRFNKNRERFTRDEILNWKKYQEKQISWPTLQKYSEQGCQYGICPGYNDCAVIDIDLKENDPYIEIKKSLVAKFFIENWNLIKDCPIVKTPSGGYHIYIKNLQKINCKFYINGYAIGEIISKNYVLIPPSQFVNSDTGEVNEYRYLNSLIDYDPQEVDLDSLGIQYQIPKQKKSKDKPIVKNGDYKKFKLVFDYKKYWQSALKKAAQQIIESVPGNRNKTFTKLIRDLSGKVEGLNQNIDDLDSLLAVYENHNPNDDCVNVFHSAIQNGLNNKYLIGKKIKYPYLDTIVRFFRFFSKLSSKNQKLVFATLYFSVPPIDDFNDTKRYIDNGFIVQSQSCRQIESICGVSYKRVNEVLKLFESKGYIKRYSSTGYYRSSIIVIGEKLTNGDEVLYIDNPLPEDQRTSYKQLTQQEWITWAREEAMIEFESILQNSLRCENEVFCDSEQIMC